MYVVTMPSGTGHDYRSSKLPTFTFGHNDPSQNFVLAEIEVTSGQFIKLFLNQVVSKIWQILIKQELNASYQCWSRLINYPRYLDEWIVFVVTGNNLLIRSRHYKIIFTTQSSNSSSNFGGFLQTEFNILYKYIYWRQSFQWLFVLFLTEKFIRSGGGFYSINEHQTTRTNIKDYCIRGRHSITVGH